MENDKENIEADNKPTAMDITNEVVAFQQKKEQLLKERGPPKPKIEKTKPEIDNTHLLKFKEKISKDFNLTCRETKDGKHIMYYKEFKMIELLPRKQWWYGVCREVPEQDNVWKAFRVNSEKDEQKHYEHLKTLVKINSENE